MFKGFWNDFQMFIISNKQTNEGNTKHLDLDLYFFFFSWGKMVFKRILFSQLAQKHPHRKKYFQNNLKVNCISEQFWKCNLHEDSYSAFQIAPSLSLEAYSLKENLWRECAENGCYPQAYSCLFKYIKRFTYNHVQKHCNILKTEQNPYCIFKRQPPSCLLLSKLTPWLRVSVGRSEPLNLTL